MDKYAALELFTEQLKRELSEALEEIERYKLSEEYWIARAKRAEAARVDSRVACRIRRGEG